MVEKGTAEGGDVVETATERNVRDAHLGERCRKPFGILQPELAEQLGKRCAQGLVDETRGVCTICLQILA